MILAKTILTLNNCRRVDNGLMRCCEQLLYIWLISHLGTKMLLFNNFKWFSQRLLEIAKQEEWKDAQRELESKIARNPARRSEVECPIYESYIFLDELQANNTSHSYYFFNMKKKMKRLSSSKPQL